MTNHCPECSTSKKIDATAVSVCECACVPCRNAAVEELVRSTEQSRQRFETLLREYEKALADIASKRSQ